MSLKDLEKKAVEIGVNGISKKVVQIKGSVLQVKGVGKPIKISLVTLETTIGGDFGSITGYQKELDMVLYSTNLALRIEGVKRFKFEGTSPVDVGDRIKFGLILDKSLEETKIGNILYLRRRKQGGSFGRIDYIDGYYPTQDDAIKLGIDYIDGSYPTRDEVKRLGLA